MGHQNIIEIFQTDISQGLKSLYEEYGKKLYGFAIYHFQLDEDDSFDALYKTLFSVGNVINRYKFTSEAHFKNWLFKIHKNNVLQILRTKKIKEFQTVSLNEWICEANVLEIDEFDVKQFKSVIDRIDEVNPFGEEKTVSPIMAAMKKALLQITEIEREILLLRMSNYSYDEIAKMLGIENNQLKVKFNRAKAKVEKITLEILKDSNNETK